MALPAVTQGFDELPADEKIEYIQTLWNRVAAHPEQVPMLNWQRELVGERVAAYRSGRTTTRPWGEVREELRASLHNVRR